MVRDSTAYYLFSLFSRHNVTELGSADPYDYNDQKTVPIPGNVTLGSEERIMTYFQWDAKDRDTWTFNGPGKFLSRKKKIVGDLTQSIRCH